MYLFRGDSVFPQLILQKQNTPDLHWLGQSQEAGTFPRSPTSDRNPFTCHHFYVLGVRWKEMKSGMRSSLNTDPLVWI